MSKVFQEEIKNLVSEGKTDKAMRVLLSRTKGYEDQPWYQELLNLKEAYEKHAQQNPKDATDDHLSLEEINKQIIEIIEKLPQKLRTQGRILRTFSKWGKTISISTVLMTIVTVTGYNLRDIFKTGNPEGPLVQSVFVKIPDGSHNYSFGSNSSLTIHFRDNQRKEVIQSDGRVDFKGIPKEYHEQKILFSLISEGVELVKADSLYLLDGERIILETKLDGSLAYVRGLVMTESGKALGKEISISVSDMSNKDVKIVLEENGRFQIEVPENLQRNRYGLTVDHPDYQLWRDYVYPSTNKDVHVVLLKANN